MEGLAGKPNQDLRAIDRLLGQATKAFEQIGKVPGAERDALADRYRVARGKLVTRAGELREADDWQRWANVPKAEALIETARQMLEAPATPDLGNRLRALQALWKEVGAMPQRRSKELWDLFKATCDQVYDKVRGQRAIEHEKFADVARAKETLIAEAEALQDSTDWAATADKLKAGTGRSRATCRASRATSCGGGSAQRATGSSSAASPSSRLATARSSPTSPPSSS
jgi:hypothetical protein